MCSSWLMGVKHYPVEVALLQLLAPQITSRGAQGASQGKGNSKTLKTHQNNRTNPKPVPTFPAAWVGTRAEAGPALSPHEGKLQAV